MKLVRDNRSVIQSDYNMESTEFGIRSADSPIIMEMLRSKIYSNKPAAVVREYITNALDEHKTHNVTKSVEVTLPTTTKPEFKVRDYGAGLSKEMIQEVYVMYGCSTKRNTDELTGGLGIGCKAAFAYGSQFTITSWWKEDDAIMKAVYVAIIDESHTGTLKVMQPPVLAEQGEDTGIEIGVGVSTNDIDQFKSEIWNLCLTSKVQPKIIGWGDDGLKLPEVITKEAKYKRYKKDNTWHFNKYRGAVAVMGNIGYPINTQQLPGITSAMRAMLNESSLHISFDIGDLSIASNREELEYNKLTITNISKAAEDILEQVLSDSANAVNNIPCYLDAQKVYSEVIQELDNSLINLLSARVNNSVCNTNIPIAKGIDYIYYEKRYHGGSDKLFADNDNHYVRFGPHSWKNNTLHIVFFDHGTSQANVTKRIKSFMNEFKEPSKMKIIAFPRDIKSSLEVMRKTVGLPFIAKDKLVNLMDYEPAKAQASISSRDSTTHVELFKMNTGSSYLMETNQWIDAGNVSISSSKAVLCMYLSGHSAITPESKHVTNVNQTDAKIPKDRLKHIINIAKEYIRYATDDEKKALSAYMVNDALSFKNADLYGVRKKHYKIIDKLPNAINLYEFAATLLSRKIKEEHAKSDVLDNHVRLKEILSTRYREPGFEDHRDSITLDGRLSKGYNWQYTRLRHSSINELLDEFNYVFTQIKKSLSTKISSTRYKLLTDLARISYAYSEPCASILIQAKELGILKLCKDKANKNTLTKTLVLKTLKTVKANWPLLNVIAKEMKQLLNKGGEYNDQDRILDDYMFGLGRRLAEDEDEKAIADNMQYNNRENTYILDSIVKYLSS